MAELSEKTLFLGMKNHDFQQILRNFFAGCFGVKNKLYSYLIDYNDVTTLLHLDILPLFQMKFFCKIFVAKRGEIAKLQTIAPFGVHGQTVFAQVIKNAKTQQTLKKRRNR
jgi:hypothetical protein